MKKTLLLSIFYWITYPGQGQDIVLSQNNHSTQIINPGRLSTDLPSIKMHYRIQPTQLESSEFFFTSVVSLNYPMAFGKDALPKFNVGATLIHHQQLLNLNTYGGLMGLSYKIALGRNRLSFGLQGGVSQSVIRDNIITANQFNASLGVFDLNLDTGEGSLSQSSNVYGTIGLGLYFASNDLFEREKFFVGISGLNVNRPIISFQKDRVNATNIPIDWNLTSGFHIRNPENPYFSISPDFRWLRRSTRNLFQIGSRFSYKFKKENHILALGTWYRTNQILVFSTDINFNRYHVSFSYDLPLSDDSSIWIGNGGLEFMLGLSLNRKGKRKKVRYRIKPIKPQPYSPIITQQTSSKRVYTKVKVRKSSLYTNDPVPTRNSSLKISEAIIYPPLKFIYYSNPKNFADFDWRKLNPLMNLLNTYPKTKILIVGEAHGLASQEANDETAYELAKRIKGYIMVNTKLRESDIIVQYNKTEKTILEDLVPKGKTMWGVSIESIMKD